MPSPPRHRRLETRGATCRSGSSRRSLICTVIYIAVAVVLIGIVPYQRLNVADPIAVGIDATGLTWFSPVVKISALFGLFSTILVQLLGQTRIFFSMSRDGLLPEVSGRVHPRFRTPYLSTILTGVGRGDCGWSAADRRAEPARQYRVAPGLRPRVHRGGDPPSHRSRCASPLPDTRVPWVPVLGALICIVQMVSLPRSTWERLIIWMAVGLVIYFLYGRSRARKETAAI